MSSLLKVLALVAGVAVVGGVVWFRVDHGTDGAQAHAAGNVKSTLHLESFVLNLSDPDQRSYLRVGIDLGLNRELKREEIVPIAEVRDTILGILTQSKGDELLTAPGKAKLKDNLLAALQQRIPQLGVEAVYFTEFLIQR